MCVCVCVYVLCIMAIECVADIHCVVQVSDEEPMLDEGEKTPEPLQEVPISPPPSITTHSYTASSSVYPGSSASLHKRKPGCNEELSRLSLGGKPESFYADITVSPPTPGECVYKFSCHTHSMSISGETCTL